MGSHGKEALDIIRELSTADRTKVTDALVRYRLKEKLEDNPILLPGNIISELREADRTKVIYSLVRERLKTKLDGFASPSQDLTSLYEVMEGLDDAFGLFAKIGKTDDRRRLTLS